ncbi:MAG: nucleotidyltransferase family protein [Candidatus Marinimicrobia bacterium]|jgi:mannose-1-phosphate guanylyltransferase|nr:nucleotidyltransferase family protein [Gammaproteobacteria bacterium]MBT4945949.1 nucleotidyltransferase family protein [Candidatus Neomarinimicrobiota bacterium]MBT5370610.1 nucleotidyltransferase family protein [Gammaproteobacteria bacterium]MBT5747085.1 nucleotidyltransferase family protein [Gammaproteobacteria bacterium]
MRAILLAAGLGTRLRPLTDVTPKCLMPIAGKPLLKIWLERLTEAGVGPFLINLHYLSEQVEEFVSHSDFSEQIELVHEAELLGTAGTLINNIDFFQGKDGLLIHADNYCLADFTAFLQAHKQRPSHCVMTMMTFRTDTPSSCGIVELDEKNVVTKFHEKVELPPGNLANGAIYILSGELMEALSGQFSDISDFSTEVLPDLLGKIYAYETPEVFIDIGSQNSYEKAIQISR